MLVAGVRDDHGARGHMRHRGGRGGRRGVHRRARRARGLARVGPTKTTRPPIVLARLVSGALFGEMALLSRAPRAASVVATRPSILLVAKRDALEAAPSSGPRSGSSSRRTAGGAWWRTWRAPRPCSSRSRLRSGRRSSSASRRASSRRATSSCTEGKRRQGLHLRRLRRGRGRGARRGARAMVLATLPAGRDGRRGGARAAPQGQRRRHRRTPDGHAVLAA